MFRVENQTVKSSSNHDTVEIQHLLALILGQSAIDATTVHFDLVGTKLIVRPEKKSLFQFADIINNLSGINILCVGGETESYSIQEFFEDILGDDKNYADHFADITQADHFIISVNDPIVTHYFKAILSYWLLHQTNNEPEFVDSRITLTPTLVSFITKIN